MLRTALFQEDPQKRKPLSNPLYGRCHSIIYLSRAGVCGWVGRRPRFPSPRSRAAGAPLSHTHGSPSPAPLCLAHTPRIPHPTLDYILSPVSLSFGVLRTSICYSLSHSVFSILHICVLACINFVFYSYFYLFTFYTSPCTVLYKFRSLDPPYITYIFIQAIPQLACINSTHFTPPLISPFYTTPPTTGLYKKNTYILTTLYKFLL